MLLANAVEAQERKQYAPQHQKHQAEKRQRPPYGRRSGLIFKQRLNLIPITRYPNG